MTDAEYWSIANSLPKRSDGTVWKVDWRTRIPNCGDGSLQSCEWVLGFNPLSGSGCWIDPGAQYVARPSPYPSASSWGVSLCNAPITQPPPSGGGGIIPPPTGSGQPTPNCPSIFYGPAMLGAFFDGATTTAKRCDPPSGYATNCRQSQVMVSGNAISKWDCSIVSNGGGSPQSNLSIPIPTWIYFAVAGFAIFMFMKN